MKYLIGTARVLLFVAFWPIPAHAQSDPPAIWTGVFTAEQAEKGKDVVLARCASCHRANQPLSGDNFMLHWEGHDVASLYTKIKDTMPPRSQSSSVSDLDKLNVVAYLLQLNGFPAGVNELPSDSAALSALRIAPRDGVVKLRNGSVVEAVGCLRQTANNKWEMSSGTEPQATTLDRGTVTAAPGDSDRPLGSSTIALLNPFPSPTEHVGKKILVKGLLVQNQGSDGINVISIVPLSADCGQ